MSDAATIHRYAHAVAAERLRSREAKLARLASDERIAVEELAHAIAGRVADSLAALPFAPLPQAHQARTEAEKEGFEPSKEVITPLTP
jgi:hypothetical protein